MTTFVENANAEKRHFTRQLKQMIFNHLLQRQGNTDLQPYRNPNSKKPDFLVLIIRNRAFLVTP
jgi:hypothetical protein